MGVFREFGICLVYKYRFWCSVGRGLSLSGTGASLPDTSDCCRACLKAESIINTCQNDSVLLIAIFFKAVGHSEEGLKQRGSKYGMGGVFKRSLIEYCSQYVLFGQILPYCSVLGAYMKTNV